MPSASGFALTTALAGSCVRHRDRAGATQRMMNAARIVDRLIRVPRVHVFFLIGEVVWWMGFSTPAVWADPPPHTHTHTHTHTQRTLVRVHVCVVARVIVCESGLRGSRFAVCLPIDTPYL